jgi:hypothetical protein
MFARIAVWEPMPDDDRQWVIDAAKSVPGVRDAYHLIDRTPATACRSHSSRTTSTSRRSRLPSQEGLTRSAGMTCRVQRRSQKRSTGLSEAVERSWRHAV